MCGFADIGLASAGTVDPAAAAKVDLRAIGIDIAFRTNTLGLGTNQTERLALFV